MLAACKGPVEANDVLELVGACRGRPVSNAAQYRNEGPNPVAVFLDKVGAGLGYTVFVPPDDDQSFFAPYLPVEQAAAKATALVACGHASGAGDLVTTCPMRDSSDKVVELKLYATRYDVEIREARTGRKLGDGVWKDAKPTCPRLVPDAGSNPREYAKPSDEAVVNLLRPYVHPNGRPPR
jgi:hypothetical protein